MIKVQLAAFDVGEEFRQFKHARKDCGAFAIFVGTVREFSSAPHDGPTLSHMTLEHYPGMTEAALADIEAAARQRWPLQDVLVIHRFGKMAVGEDIVLVITASAHRTAAFESCQFIMDYLKTKAPFWKLEEGAGSGAATQNWVEARDADDLALEKWK